MNLAVIVYGGVAVCGLSGAPEASATRVSASSLASFSTVTALRLKRTQPNAKQSALTKIMEERGWEELPPHVETAYKAAERRMSVRIK
jgi:hypothetical protein